MVTTESGLFQCCHFVLGKADNNAQSKIRVSMHMVPSERWELSYYSLKIVNIYTPCAVL